MTSTKRTPIILIILDGWGHREEQEHNAIAEARTPFFDSLLKSYPHSLLNASEHHVGLPSGQIGNSEIGHMTMGAGRVIDTDLIKINKAAARGDFSSNPAFVQLFDHVTSHDSILHILGLVSPGGIHSHQEHLHAFLRSAKAAGVTKLAIHAFTDGRDVPPKSAANYIKELETVLADVGIGKIATMTGRLYAMDRDKNWDRIKMAEDAIFESKGTMSALKPHKQIEEFYRTYQTDELLPPTIFVYDNSRKGITIGQNDGVFVFNYRPDRVRQITQKILARKSAKNLMVVTMTEYDQSFDTVVAFGENKVDDCLAAIVSKAGLSQSHIAETEKYPHVTYFFNGGQEEPHEREHHFLIDSRKDVLTHDQAPEMRAKEIADKATERIAAGDDFILINFANADMVGHTANKPAIITAVETVDMELKKVVNAALEKGGVAIITADHGNAEVNVDQTTGEKHTAHTLNVVPFIVTKKDVKLLNGSLADIAPTVLELMSLPKPAVMTGRSLIER